MPITKSAKKALRAAAAKTSTNRHRKALLKEALRNVTSETFSRAVSAIDKAAKWGIIHPSKAARLKSALAKRVKQPAKAAAKSAKPTKTVKKTATKAKAPAKQPAKKTVAKKK